jgi:hypothetical protein
MIKLSDYRCNNIFKDIIRLVKSKPPSFFHIKKLRGYAGWCVWEDTLIGDHIQLDYRNCLLSTAIHECVHYLYPEWCESQVAYAEKRIVNTIDSFFLSKLLVELTNKIYQCEFGKRKKLYGKPKPVRRSKTIKKYAIHR